MSGEGTPAKAPNRMDREAAFRVYDQYWHHARHVETQLHSFLGFYVVMVGGALALSAGAGDLEKMVGATFALMLSILGLFFNYNLRVPFIRFTLTSEVIAIREFGLKADYRRFFDSKGKLVKDKRIGKYDIDTYDIFALLFFLGAVLSVAGLVFFLIAAAGEICITIQILAAAVLALVTALLLIWFYLWTKAQLDATKEGVERTTTKEATDRD